MIEVDLVSSRGGFTLQARFAAPTPGVVALFGPSGAGKSTLVGALAGLLPARGRFAIDGSVLLDSDAGIAVPTELRRIGYVFQDARLFPHLDVAGNLRYAERRARHAEPYARRGEIVELLGLEALMTRRVHALSGGERQRVALGRALLGQPRLLMLDEPLSAIDVARRAEVLPYLESLRDRYALPMLYVSHQYDEVLRLATHVVLLSGGRVSASGTPTELGADPRLGAVIGTDALGAVLDATVCSRDPATGVAAIELAAGRTVLQLALPPVAIGQRLRINVLARDVILATEPPRGLSVRNALRGSLAELEDESADSVLARVDVAGAALYARITRAAVSELGLRPGLELWVLVKAASLRGHAFGGELAALS